MDYSFCKLIDDNDYFDIIPIMFGFDCICSLMTKVEMIGRNLTNGEYVISSFNEDTEDIQLEIVVIVEDGNIDVVDAKDYFD